MSSSPPSPLSSWRQDLARRLGEPLPGLPAQREMAPSGRRFHPGEDPVRQAGVVALLVPPPPGESGWSRQRLVLTVRSAHLAHHPGQVCLPGGGLHRQESPAVAAIRELDEELGVPGDSVTILGALSPLFVSVSGYQIHPLVGATDEPLESLRADPSEVDRIVPVALADLLDPATVRRRRDSARERAVPYFAVADLEVWGATAMILAEFLAVVRTVDGSEGGLLI